MDNETAPRTHIGITLNGKPRRGVVLLDTDEKRKAFKRLLREQFGITTSGQFAEVACLSTFEASRAFNHPEKLATSTIWTLVKPGRGALWRLAWDEFKDSDETPDDMDRLNRKVNAITEFCSSIEGFFPRFTNEEKEDGARALQAECDRKLVALALQVLDSDGLARVAASIMNAIRDGRVSDEYDAPALSELAKKFNTQGFASLVTYTVERSDTPEAKAVAQALGMAVAEIDGDSDDS